MIIVSYDISDNKKRSRFAKYLSRFGHRIQYSVFEIDHSSRILNNIKQDIENRFKKTFGQEDSVYILELSTACKITKYGNAENKDKDLIILG